MERLSTTENLSDSLKKPLDGNIKGAKSKTKTILSQFPKERKTTNEELIEAVFGLAVVLTIGAFLVTITLIRDFTRAEEPTELTSYPIVREEVKPAEPVIVVAAEPTDDYLIASIVMAEAEGEEMVGKVAVASVILNRCENWNKTVSEVINEPNQFAKGKEPNEDCLRAVEIAKDTRDLYPSDMIYFRNAHYHDFGCPFLVIGGHYFSTETTEKGISK